MNKLQRPLLMVAALVAASTLSACAPLLLGGAAFGGALVYTDRRTTATQIEDESIESKAGKRIDALLGQRAHVDVTSYNRIVLITGEVPDDAARAQVEATVAGVDTVRTVVNETTVAGPSNLSTRSGDAVITSKVKASIVDVPDLQANAFKVVTERGVVYLMGRVTEREASRAVDIARAIAGVYKVVRVFEIVTEDELKALQPPPAPVPALPKK